MNNAPCTQFDTAGSPHASLPCIEQLDALAAITHWHCGEEICGEADAAAHLYCVICGAARECTYQMDGRRRIIDLLLPGDFFGLTPHQEYDYTIEAAAQGTTMARYPRRRLEALSQSDPRVAHYIHLLGFKTICRLQIQMLVMGKTTAVEKVGAFLGMIESRLSKDGSDQVVLPISRYDIADYLAISVETMHLHGPDAESEHAGNLLV